MNTEFQTDGHRFVPPDVPPVANRCPTQLANMMAGSAHVCCPTWKRWLAGRTANDAEQIELDANCGRQAELVQRLPNRDQTSGNRGDLSSSGTPPPETCARKKRIKRSVSGFTSHTFDRPPPSRPGSQEIPPVGPVGGHILRV